MKFMNNKTNKILAALFFLLIPMQSFAKETMKKFRWEAKPAAGLPRTNLKSMSTFFSEIASPAVDPNAGLYLKETGELVLRESQTLNDAPIHGTWKQSILNKDGTLLYAAGEIYSSLPEVLLPLGAEKNKNSSEANLPMAFLNGLPELKNAAKVFPARLEVRQTANNVWESYWRVDYLSPNEDQMKYLLLNSGGQVLSRGELPWDGLDGKALVFPKGPKMSSLQEAPLKGLVGDGTLKGLHLWVQSVLNLNVWQPDLIFFYPKEDQRFDLSQVYYTIEQSYDWLKNHLGVEVSRPVEVRLHVGENGISNAAFYHQNTIYLGVGDGTTYKDMLRDPSVVTHESIHAIIDTYVGLPSDGEGGSFNEGFSDLFTALILENPRLGEASYLKGPYRRTLENKLKAYTDFNTGVYQNGTIVGATFWDMKPWLGTDLTAKLAFRTLVRLGKGGKFADFMPALSAAADSMMSPEQKAKIMQTAIDRGWKIEQ